MEYDKIIPIGYNCNSCICLRESNLRKESFPFDWIGSNTLDKVIPKSIP